jgi:hypothetical protein
LDASRYNLDPSCSLSLSFYHLTLTYSILDRFNEATSGSEAYFPSFNATMKFGGKDHHSAFTFSQYSKPDLRHLVLKALGLRSRDIVVLNFGTHYNDEGDYYTDMETFAKEMLDLKEGIDKDKVPSFFFLETPPQHFVGSNHGNYDAADHRRLDRCKPSTNETLRAYHDFRNKIARYHLNPLQDLGMMRIINCAQALYRQWDAHVAADNTLTKVSTADCTHCLTPSGVFHYIHTAIFNDIDLYAPQSFSIPKR